MAHAAVWNCVGNSQYDCVSPVSLGRETRMPHVTLVPHLLKSFSSTAASIHLLDKTLSRQDTACPFAEGDAGDR